MNGLHLIADLYQCGGHKSFLLDRPVLEELCVNECRRIGLTPLGSYFYQFEYDSGQPAGVTGTVVLAESHLAIHTWPETGDVTLDVYVCNFSRDNGALAESLFSSLIQTLKPKSSARHQVVRGGRDAQGNILPTNETSPPPSTLYESLNQEIGFYLQGATLLESGRSDYQEYDVWQTAQFGKIFRLDGFLMTSENDEFLYHENLIHVPALSHGSVRRALIIGGGDGGSAEELFKLPHIEQVTLVELDEAVVSLARKYFDRVHHGALDDKRLNLRIENGLDYVNNTAGQESFDLIVLDLTDPLGEAKPLYEEAFFRACKKLLTPRGALSLHIGSPNFQPERVRAIMAALRNVFQHVDPYFVYIPLYGSLWGMACASDALVPRETPASEIESRIASLKGLPLQHYNGEIHHAQFALSNQLRAILAP